MQQEPNEAKQEECISIKGCKIILRYSEAPKAKVLDNMGKILCGQIGRGRNRGGQLNEVNWHHSQGG